MSSKTRQTNKLLRNYGVISLIAVTLSSVIIFSFFRFQAINTIQTANEVSYSALAYAIADSLNHHLVQYFQVMHEASDRKEALPTLDNEAKEVIQHLLVDTPIKRIKIYDRSGKVVYSTLQSQIGKVQDNNPGFIAAINGTNATKLIYRDTLNVFDQQVEEANLLQYYLPIRKDEISRPIGVFEIYADINEQVVDISRIELLVLAFIVLVMSGLYFVLTLYVKRAEKVVGEQHRLSIEKQKMLELLSAKMINAQEDEKKRISDELHENVVQTISAVKLYFEQCVMSVSNNQKEHDLSVPSHVVPMLQEAIKKIRSVSLDLRPPSLDKFGLKAATHTLINEFNSILTGMKIKIAIDLPEEVLSDDKRSIIFRILKDTLRMISLHQELTGEILIRLGFNEISGNLQLSVEVANDNVAQCYYETNDFELMRESTILSGGEFTVSHDSSGIIRAIAEWERI